MRIKRELFYLLQLIDICITELECCNPRQRQLRRLVSIDSDQCLSFKQQMLGDALGAKQGSTTELCHTLQQQVLGIFFTHAFDRGINSHQQGRPGQKLLWT